MTRLTSAHILLSLLAVGAPAQRSAGQARDSTHSVPTSVPCAVPLPRDPTDVVTLDLALLERCSGRPIPEDFRILADTANEAGVIHKAAVAAANRLYRKYTNVEGDLSDLLAALAYIRMAEQTLVPESYQQGQFIGRQIALTIGGRLAEQAVSTQSCVTLRAARLFFEESLRYRVFENPAHRPGTRDFIKDVDSVATARLEGGCVR